jgi:hypothetical protein
VVKTEKEEEFQTPPEKVCKLTTPPTSKIGWLKKMIATPSSSEEKTKAKTEVKQEPITPVPSSSSSTPIARRTRKALQTKKIPQKDKSSISENWITY